MPDWTQRVRERLAGLDLDPATEAEVVLELTQHVDDRYRDLLARGLSDTDAETQAWRELDGHPRLARDLARARRALVAAPAPAHNVSRHGLRALWDDVVFAGRRLRHAPGFAIVAVLTVALTVGANTAILTVADAVLFRPLPYADPDRIGIVQMLDRGTGLRYTATPVSLLQAIEQRVPSVRGVGYLGEGRPLQIEGPEGPVRVPVAVTSANYLTLLGTRPALGRVFSEDDRGAEGRAAVLTWRAWQSHFGGDPAVVGQTVALGASTFEILGVLPADFVFPSHFASARGVVVFGDLGRPGQTGSAFHSIVRLAPGVSFARARAEVDAVTATVVRSASEPDKGQTWPVVDPAREVLYPIGRDIMGYLLAAAGLIFLAGGANLAILMLVRSRRGLREIATRVALGASRVRLVRPMLFEALAISLAGAAGAVGLGALTFAAIRTQVPAHVYGQAPIGLSARVVTATFVLALASAFLFSLIPAWRAAGVDAQSLLRRAGAPRRPGRRPGQALVAWQVAVAVAIAFFAGASTRAFITVLNTPLGFSTDRVLTINALMPPEGTTDAQAFYRRAFEALARDPNIVAVGATGTLPFTPNSPFSGVTVPGDGRRVGGLVHTLPGYFEAAQIPIIEGRPLVWEDDQSEPRGVVVSETAARALAQEGPVLGAIVQAGRTPQMYRIVGVAADVRPSLRYDAQPWVYALPGADLRGVSVIARVRERRAGVADDIARIAGPLSRFPPRIVWWSDTVFNDDGYRNPRFQAIVLGTLATLALGLTTLGIFSVVAWLVTARTREMGVRLAIGASPGSLVGLIVRQSIAPVAVGLGAGLLLIVWGRGLAEAQFVGVTTTDPAMLAAAAAAVVIAALLAAWLPARRATRINPTDVLRAE